MITQILSFIVSWAFGRYSRGSLKLVKDVCDGIFKVRIENFENLHSVHEVFSDYNYIKSFYFYAIHFILKIKLQLGPSPFYRLNFPENKWKNLKYINNLL